MPRSPIVAHALTVAWAVLLALLLLLPAEAYDPTGAGWLDRLLDSVPGIDKVAHAVLFAGMARLAHRSLTLSGVARAALWAAVAAVVYGVALELLQGPIPGRSTGGLDMIANAVGAIAGAMGGAIMAPSPERSPPDRAAAMRGEPEP